MTGACGAIAPGTHYEDEDASVSEVRCMLPRDHTGVHAAIVEWTPDGVLGWPDGGALNGKLLSREYLP